MDIRKQIVYKKTSDLKPYEKNPRKNDDAVQYVANSIKEFNFQSPIIIDKDGTIVCGHTRWKAAKKLGMKEVPCIMADDLTPEQIKAFRLADNKVSELAEWDFDLLSEELGGLEMDMTEFGFTEEDTKKDDNEEQEPHEDDGPDEIPAVPTAKKGDIYKLGEHYLMCGDSTKSEDVETLMHGEKADLVLTDPPYNVDYVKKRNGNISVNRDITNDALTRNGYYDFLASAFHCMESAMKDGCPFYVWYATFYTSEVYAALISAGLKPRAPLVWVKDRFVFSFNDYLQSSEPCIYSWKGTHHYFIEDRTNRTVLRDDTPDFDHISKQEAVDLLKAIFAYTDAIHEDKPQKSDLHPTMKPVKLFARLIKNSSLKGDIVLDLFGGSGTTIIACEQLKRKCYMMEYDPRYVDVIIARWEKETGKTAELIQEGDSHDGED